MVVYNSCFYINQTKICIIKGLGNIFPFHFVYDVSTKILTGICTSLNGTVYIF